MRPLSPALFIATAKGLAGWKNAVAGIEGSPSGDRWSDDTDSSASSTNLSASTAAFIAHVGYWSHHSRAGTAWPFPLDADCSRLASIAGKMGVLHALTPEPGHIHLQWSKEEKAFVRAGIILWAVEVPARPWKPWSYDLLVIEGAGELVRCDAPGGARGADVVDSVVTSARRRRVCACPADGDRFISWVDLDGRGETTRMRPQPSLLEGAA